MRPEKIALSLSNVTRDFDGFSAVSEVNLDISESEIICLVGPSGCGKSTLLNMLAGFDHPTEGRVQAHGSDVVSPGSERAVIFQQDALFPWLKTYDNVISGVKARGVKGYESRAEKLLAQVRLTEFSHRYPYQLSGGMRQRAAIARALIGDSKALLMDEPFAALDAQTRSEMHDLLQTVWDDYHPTIVFITHDIEEALILGDRVAVMAPRPGRIVDVIDVGFPRPRTLELTTQSDFNKLKSEILHQLRPKEKAA